jgi:hypothetical protein
MGPIVGILVRGLIVLAVGAGGVVSCMSCYRERREKTRQTAHTIRTELDDLEAGQYGVTAVTEDSERIPGSSEGNLTLPPPAYQDPYGFPDEPIPSHQHVLQPFLPGQGDVGRV